LKTPALFYVPFYLVRYEAGLTRRYLMLAPSAISGFDFSAKLKGAFGLSKTRDLLVPRFKAISALISKVEDLAKQNSMFESQIFDLTQRNNLLNNASFRENVTRGLVSLNHEGWISNRERQFLSNQISM